MSSQSIHLKVQDSTPGAKQGVTQTIVAGDGFSLALGSDGTYWAWGANDAGQLGDGTQEGKRAPVELAGLAGLSALAAGGKHCLGLRPDGAAWVWGDNERGQLGLGDKQTQLQPVDEGDLSGVRWLGAGRAHSLVVRAGGTVWAWGDNDQGQLGDGSRRERLEPTRVEGLSEVIQTAAGGTHSLALQADGSVWAWGSNADGQLGDGSRADQLRPVRVANLQQVRAIAAGEAHSLALRADGTVWAWGRNDQGQVGDGSESNSRHKPVRVSEDATRVAAAGSFSLALKVDGTLQAWGENASGQLGTADQTDRGEPAAVVQLAGVMAIAAGRTHCLAVRADGSVWAWGDNAHGQLGLGDDGSTACSTRPVRISQLEQSGRHVAAGSGRHAFGECEVGSRSASVLFTIDNRSDAERSGLRIEISGAGADQFRVDAQPEGPLAAWGQGGFRLRFVPTELGEQRATVAIKQGGEELFSFTITGTGSAGMDVSVKLPPQVGRYDFGDLEVGEESDEVLFAIENHGAAELRLTGDPRVELEGEAVHFRLSTEPAAVVPPGERTRFGLVFAPQNSGQKSAGLKLANSHSPDFPYTFTIRGRAVGAEINIKQAGTDVLSGGQVSPFAERSLGSESPPVAFTIENQGLGTLRLSGSPPVVLSGDGAAAFRVVTQPSALVGAQQEASFSLAFQPTAAGEQQATVRIANNDADEHPYTFVVRGTGGAATGRQSIKLALAGGAHQLIINPSGGSVWAWGNNEHGRLGTGGAIFGQGQAKGLSQVVAVACGWLHSLALDATGQLWVWGYNGHGELGDGTKSSRSVPQKGSRYALIGSGAYHVLALGLDDAVYAWGLNDYGQLGDGTKTSRTRAVKVQGLPKVKCLSGGDRHSLAVDLEGKVWAWGKQHVGQLGNGVGVDLGQTVPLRLRQLEDITEVSCGDNHSLALDESGKVWAFGYNSSGQIGDGTTTNRITPTEVTGLPPIRSVSAGVSHSLALARDGTAWAWGNNSHGELGLNRSEASRRRPEKIGQLSNVTALSAGGYHSFAITADGKVWRWGLADYRYGNYGSYHKRAPLEQAWLVLGA